MKDRALDVLINTTLVGRLHETDDLWRFEYTPAWCKAVDGFDLSPALARAQPCHTDGASQRPVQWYFDNLLPEEALRTILAKEADLPSEDAFGLLRYFGAESAGSLVLCAADTSDYPASPAEQGLRPLPLTTLNRRITHLPKVSLGWEAPKKMSLAGAQHKMLVVQRGSDLFEPLAQTPSTHILKPNHPGEDYPASVMNEFFTMRLAAAVGLDVAKVAHLYVPQPVYIVERFDRVPHGSGGDAVARRHVIDTCQLLNKARTFKYSAAHLDSLAQAITHCRTKTRARLQLLRWLIFNLLVGNGDNHLKNISFLVDASGIHVAPAYDLLSTAVYDTPAMAQDQARWPHTALALSLGSATTFATVTRADVLHAGQVLGLHETTTARELNQLCQTLPIKADALMTEISAGAEQAAAASPDPNTTRLHIAGELRLLRAIRHIVIADMVRQLA